MRGVHYIAMDTHCVKTEMAVVTASGRLTQRASCRTTIPELVQALESVPRPRYLTFEEGPLAGWLYRNLRLHVDELLVCEPRRNALIAKDSDKDDPIDAEKLANLYRGGYLKPVHQPESLERAVFRQHVALYHDRVRQRVREANRIIAECRHHGLIVQERHFARAGAERDAIVTQLPESELLRENVRRLWESYDVVAAQVQQMRTRLEALAKQEEVIVRFVALPGIRWVRAATLFVYLDSPGRFRNKSALWKYMGIGLERSHSGQGPVQLQVCQQANHLLRGTILGAAQKAIEQGDNPFAVQYHQWLEGGISAHNARRNVARSLSATLWGMWKNGSAYHPEWVGVEGSRLTVGASRRT